MPAFAAASTSNSCANSGEARGLTLAQQVDSKIGYFVPLLASDSCNFRCRISDVSQVHRLTMRVLRRVAPDRSVRILDNGQREPKSNDKEPGIPKSGNPDGHGI